MRSRTTTPFAGSSKQPAADILLLPYLVSIAKSVRQLVGIKLAEHGVAPGQDQFLLCFSDHAPRSVAEIAKCLSVRASTISKMTDILTDKGWAVRHADAHDARKVLVALTDAGIDVRNEVRRIWRCLETELMAGLADQSRTTTVLVEIDSVLNQRLKRLR